MFTSTGSTNKPFLTRGQKLIFFNWPVLYMIDGVQYIAVQSGWGVDAETMQASFNIVREDKTIVPRDGAIWVFALKDKSMAN